MEKIYDSLVKVKLGNKKISVYYSYKENFTFIDLLEYLSYLFPKFEICQCFKFRLKEKNNGNEINYIDIPNDCYISDFSQYLNDLYLDDSKKYCFEHKSKNYFKYSKTELISSFEDDISKLEYINKKRKNEIDLLEKNKLVYINEIEDLKKKINIKDLRNYLIEENKNLKLEINKLQNKIKQNKDNRILEKSINEVLDKIKLHSAYEDNLEEKDGPIDNQKYIKNRSIDFYDVIVHIDSIKDINKGWKIEFNEKTKENYESFKNQKMIKIGIIGNLNRGKSFILSKISKIKLPSGTSIRTEGLSIKYPDLKKFKERKIALLDSAGLETPILNLNNEKLMDNDIINKLFIEIFRDKISTEFFLQNYIINNSDFFLLLLLEF